MPSKRSGMPREALSARIAVRKPTARSPLRAGEPDEGAEAGRRGWDGCAVVLEHDRKHHGAGKAVGNAVKPAEVWAMAWTLPTLARVKAQPASKDARTIPARAR